MRKPEHFDVVVAGGGLVGAAFAARLGHTPLALALVESRGPQPAPQSDEDWDARIYAVSPASAHFLSELGAWGAIDGRRLTPIRRMHVFGDDGSANIVFDALATGVPELAWIVEGRTLHAALWGLLQRQNNLRLLCPAQCAALAFDDGRARITLDGGERISGALVVGADGAHSWLREAAGFAADDKPYGQFGVVANFATERDHAGTAYQWFRPEGTLAYLPLPGRRISIVWSAHDAFARGLQALPPAEFARRVAEAGHNTLGALQLITPAQGFPLRLLTVAQTVAPGVALIGDAAHVVHPLAGQGVNLGFADAQALAATLVAREPFRACGDSRLLRRYERGRREQHFTLQCVTDGLQRLFSSESPMLRQARNRGLELADALPVLKNLLARRALGGF
jgi:ubiquinone biosynthesis UbiH/UbiF/VisC/COQ6 family hydroxylase